MIKPHDFKKVLRKYLMSMVGIAIIIGVLGYVGYSDSKIHANFFVNLHKKGLI